jgi:hypothetical protein
MAFLQLGEMKKQTFKGGRYDRLGNPKRGVTIWRRQ